MDKLKAFWASLPHKVQAGIVAGLTAVVTTFAQAYSHPPLCFALVCLKQHAAASLFAGMAALRAFYMLPNVPVKPADSAQ